MQPVLANQGIGSSSTATDNIILELHDGSGNLVSTTSGLLNIDGTTTVEFPYVTTPHYIAVKHRGSLETWSAVPLAMGSTVSYDFTTAASKAYGNNMVEVSSGVWAFYTGDLNNDGFIDGNDYPVFDAENYNGTAGVYTASDMNGDGFVDGNDYPLFDMNSYNGVSSVHP